ncbi:hypothetical protein J6O48_07590 [bacterium]|nr:hypothetical protein [bacterium]
MKHNFFNNQRVLLTEQMNNNDIFEKAYPEYSNFILFEEYHVINMFDDVIDDIVSIYHNNKDLNKLIYTQYNFNVFKQTCSKLNNESKDIPIYIKIINAKFNSEYSAVDDNDLTNIIIELNKSKIVNDIILKSCLQHEFLHVREMFAKPFYNILKSNKNRIPENEDNLFIYLNDNLFNTIIDICYVFNKSEERARINATTKYIKEKYKSFNIDFSNKNDVIAKIIRETKTLSLVLKMKQYIDFLDLKFQNQNQSMCFFEALNYYCYKYHLTNKKLKAYNYNNFIKKNDINNQDLLILKQTITDLKNNYRLYFSKLNNVIYNEIIKFTK